MSEVKGNLGHWSELYALAYLLVHRGVFGPPAVEYGSKHFFPVIEVFVRESGKRQFRQYVLADDHVTLRDGMHSDRAIDLDRISELLERLLKDLRSPGSTRHFTLESGLQLMNYLGKSDIAASSNQRVSDFELVISDPQTGNPTPRIGCSVKSSIGSPATLLNASGATNFVYEINGPPGLDPRKVISGDSLKKHIRQLIDSGFAISFRHLDSSTFQENLMKVDSAMPELLSEVLLNSLLQASPNFNEIIESTHSSSDPLGQQRIFKSKQLLGSIAMGLRPSQAWDGDPTRFKGMIVVDSVGDITFNYQFNQLDFWEFLYTNAKFEIPSRSRHKFGQIYSEGGRFFIKLNLQIRFKK